MKGKKSLKIIVITAFVMVLSMLDTTPFSLNNTPKTAQAAAPKIEYLGNVTYSRYIVGKFKVNGKYAFCLDHYKNSPPTGSSYSSGSVYNNESIRAILYYGYGGAGNVVGTSDAAWVATSLALDTVMNDNHTSGRSTVPGYDKLIEHANKKDAPKTTASFSRTKASSSVSGNVQKSQTITFNADSRNSITLKVPANVTLHVGGKTYTNRNVTIKGGQSFYLTAPLSYGRDVTFSNVKPSLEIYQTFIYKPSNGSQQRLGQGIKNDPQALQSLTVDFQVRQKKITVQHIDKHTNKVLNIESYTRNIGSNYTFSPKSSIISGSNKYFPVDNKKQTGKLGSKNITLKFYYNLERTITINHIDIRDNRLINKESHKALRGSSYSYGPKTNLKKGEYTYRPVSTSKKTGTVGANNIKIDFYYDIPLIQVGLERIRVYTAPAKDGLPVKLDLSKKNNYPESNEHMANAKLSVALYDGNKKLDAKTYIAKSLPKNIEFTVPSEYLNVNEKRAYTIKFENYSKNDIDVIPNAESITTDGYTSSQETINTNNTSLPFTGVIMTEKEVGKNMKLYNEHLEIKVNKLDKKLTGYGFEYPVHVTYINDLGQKLISEFELHTPKALVDSYLTYPLTNNQYQIKLDETNHNQITKGEILTTIRHYELPEVNIEKRTGNLFSNSQVAAKDKQIKYELIKGGRKFYTPIWGDLGIYTIAIKNVNPLGIHQINVSMKQDLNIYAYMYGHMDSNTGKQDAIYLRPINADDPKYPDNWTADDIKRFEKWNRN